MNPTPLKNLCERALRLLSHSFAPRALAATGPRDTGASPLTENQMRSAIRALHASVTPSDALNDRITGMAGDAGKRVVRRRRVMLGVTASGCVAVVAGSAVVGPRLLIAGQLWQTSARLRAMPLRIAVADVGPNGAETVIEQYWTQGDDTLLLTDEDVVARRMDRLFYGLAGEDNPVRVGSALKSSPETQPLMQRLQVPYLPQLSEAVVPLGNGKPQVVGWQRAMQAPVLQITLSLPNGEQAQWFLDTRTGLPGHVDVQRKQIGMWKTYRRATFSQISGLPVMWTSAAWRLRQKPGNGAPREYETCYASRKRKDFTFDAARLAITSIYMRVDGIVMVNYSQGATQKNRALNLRLQGYGEPVFRPQEVTNVGFHPYRGTYYKVSHQPYYNGFDEFLCAQFTPQTRQTAARSTRLTTRDLTLLLEEPTPQGVEMHRQVVPLDRIVGQTPQYVHIIARPGSENTRQKASTAVPYYFWHSKEVNYFKAGKDNVWISSVFMDLNGNVFMECHTRPYYKGFVPEIRITGYRAPAPTYVSSPYKFVPLTPPEQGWVGRHEKIAIDLLIGGASLNKKRQTRTITLARTLSTPLNPLGGIVPWGFKGYGVK